MWTNLRKEIESIRISHSLTEKQFQPLGLNDWQKIENRIYETFSAATNQSKPVWLWDHLKPGSYAITLRHSYKYLDRLIDDEQTVWFFVNEIVNERDKKWFYQGQVKAIQMIIGESAHITELYLVSKKFEWLIGINHHDKLIATGSIVIAKLQGVENSSYFR